MFFDGDEISFGYFGKSSIVGHRAGVEGPNFRRVVVCYDAFDGQICAVKFLVSVEDIELRN